MHTNDDDQHAAEAAEVHDSGRTPMSDIAPVERKCDYCKEPGATARASAPAFEGAAQQFEYHHEHCYQTVSVLRMYQQLLNSINQMNLAPFDVAMRRVVERKFTGFLDVRLVIEDRRPVIESSIKMCLRPPNVPARRGWLSVPISPELAGALHRGLAAGEGISPEHSDRAEYVMDVDVSKQTESPEERS